MRPWQSAICFLSSLALAMDFDSMHTLLTCNIQGCLARNVLLRPIQISMSMFEDTLHCIYLEFWQPGFDIARYSSWALYGIHVQPHFLLLL